MTEHISPSAIELWRTCNRKFTLQVIFGHPKKAASVGTLFGRDVDSITEHALKTGELKIDPQNPTAGETAREILATLPVVSVVTQKDYKVLAPSKILEYHWVGRLDVYADRAIPLVADVKTRAKEIHVLRRQHFPTDPQCVQYAYAHDKGEGVDLQWVTALTGTKREPIIERDRWTSEQIQEYAHTLALDSDQIVQLKRSKPTSADDVPYNLEGCTAFGGCPYRGNACQLPLSAMVESIFGKEGQSNMSNLMDQLKNQSAGTAPPAAAANGTVPAMDLSSFFGKPAAPPAPVAPLRGSEEYAKSKAVPLPADAKAPNGRELPAYMKQTGIVQSGAEYWAISDLIEHGEQERAVMFLNAVSLPEGPAINPPESAHAATPAATLQALQAPPAAPASPAAPAAEGDAPKRRGRPKGSKNANAGAKPANATDGKVLYIGCAPLGSDYTALEDLYADAHDAIAREKGVPDFGLLPYGEGAAAFRGFVLAAWNGEGPGEYVVQDANSRESTIALAGIAQSADRVIRGFR